MPSPIVYAHRGANRERPENTMEAFERALELGADAIELDVHMSRDGVVVVAHDDTGLRMADEPALIRNTQYSRLRAWNMGRNFAPKGVALHSGSSYAYRMPMLEEVLGHYPNTFVNIDVKALDPNAVHATLRAIERTRATDRVRLTSFAHAVTTRIAASPYRGLMGASRTDVARVLALPTRLLALLPTRFDSLQIPVRFGALALATPRLLAKARALRLRVDFWVVNDPAEGKRVLDLGASGIVTDDVRLFR